MGRVTWQELSAEEARAKYGDSLIIVLNTPPTAKTPSKPMPPDDVNPFPGVA